jgi:hypothetical protein
MAPGKIVLAGKKGHFFGLLHTAKKADRLRRSMGIKSRPVAACRGRLTVTCLSFPGLMVMNLR